MGMLWTLLFRIPVISVGERVLPNSNFCSEGNADSLLRPRQLAHCN